MKRYCVQTIILHICFKNSVYFNLPSSTKLFWVKVTIFSESNKMLIFFNENLQAYNKILNNLMTVNHFILILIWTIDLSIINPTKTLRKLQVKKSFSRRKSGDIKKGPSYLINSLIFIEVLIIVFNEICLFNTNKLSLEATNS